MNQEAVPPPQAATPLRRPAASGPAAAGRRRRQSGGASLSINRHRHQQPPPRQLVCEPLITRRLTASLTSLSCVAATGKTHGRRQGYSTAANSSWWLRPQQQPQKPCRQAGAGVVRCRLPAPSAVPRSPAAAHLRARRRLGARVFGALLRAGAPAGRGRSTSGAWPAECGGAVRVGRCRWGQPKQPLRKRRPGQARTGQDRPGQARTGPPPRCASAQRPGPATQGVVPPAPTSAMRSVVASRSKLPWRSSSRPSSLCIIRLAPGVQQQQQQAGGRAQGGSRRLAALHHAAQDPCSRRARALGGHG